LSQSEIAVPDLNLPSKLVTVCLSLLSITSVNIDAEEDTATLAGGCFWCMESDFEKVDGVLSVVSGYTGGSLSNPSYKQVSTGNTGHTEAVQITFDNTRISFDQLLEHFWVNIDPEDGSGQFCDRGLQYRSEVFYHNDAQKQAALASLDKVIASGKLSVSVATEITMATDFYIAEEYHQDYYKKNPTRYNYYRWSCGRDKRLKQLWGSKD
jgi:peptide-methionine (S)-S-oxide reductase